MRYEGTIYRPPGERNSYLLQVTVGCSHNACAFCGMYKDKRYHVRPIRDILEDILMAKNYYGDVPRVFLCDGDAIGLPTEDLLRILHALRLTFPSLQKVATFAGPKPTLKKTPEELRALREAGLTRVYLGVESGSDALLKEMVKGVTAEEMLRAGTMLREAGLDLWAMILLGLDGHGAGLEHARASTEIINAMRPRHLSLLSLVMEPGTRLYRYWKSGEFVQCTPEEILCQVRYMVANLTVDPLHFTCDHASNYLPLKGTLSEERERFLAAIDSALAGELRIRPEDSRRV